MLRGKTMNFGKPVYHKEALGSSLLHVTMARTQISVYISEKLSVRRCCMQQRGQHYFGYTIQPHVSEPCFNRTPWLFELYANPAEFHIFFMSVSQLGLIEPWINRIPALSN